MNKRVFVLGHRGMLGHVVARFVSSMGAEVCVSNKRYEGQPDDPLISAVRESSCDWVINAAGLIKQKSSDPSQLFLINSVLPIHLAQQLRPDQRLIHASSDCVFSGKGTYYSTHDHRDAEDNYGLSKSLGEQIELDPKVLVLRVSIIGPELGSAQGLLQWFVNQKGPVRGFTNHFWNGITTLDWAQTAWRVITGDAPSQTGLVQLGTSERSSKHDILMMIKEYWNLDTEVTAYDHEDTIDRTLKPDWIQRPLREQLLSLRAWIQKSDYKHSGDRIKYFE